MVKFLLFIFHHGADPVRLDIDDPNQWNADQNKNDGEIFFHTDNINSPGKRDRPGILQSDKFIKQYPSD